MDRRVVEFVVKDRAAKVFDCVLDGSDNQDDNKRDGVQTRVGRAKDGEDLALVLSAVLSNMNVLDLHRG